MLLHFTFMQITKIYQNTWTSINRVSNIFSLYLLHSPLCKIKSRFFWITVFLRVPSVGSMKEVSFQILNHQRSLSWQWCAGEWLALNRFLVSSLPFPTALAFHNRKTTLGHPELCFVPKRRNDWRTHHPWGRISWELKKHRQGSAFFHPGQILGKSLCLGQWLS